MIYDRELLGVETLGELVTDLKLIECSGEVPFEDPQLVSNALESGTLALERIGQWKPDLGLRPLE